MKRSGGLLSKTTNRIANKEFSSLFFLFQGFFSFADFKYESSDDGGGNVAALVTSPKNPLFLGGGEDPR